MSYTASYKESDKKGKCYKEKLIMILLQKGVLWNEENTFSYMKSYHGRNTSTYAPLQTKETRWQWLCLMKMVLFLLVLKVIHGHCTRLSQNKEMKRKWKQRMNWPLRDNYFVLGTHTHMPLEILLSKVYNLDKKCKAKWDYTI